MYTAISFHALSCTIVAAACALAALFMSSITAAIDCGSAPLNMPAKPAKASWDVTDGIIGGPTATGSLPGTRLAWCWLAMKVILRRELPACKKEQQKRYIQETLLLCITDPVM